MGDLKTMINAQFCLVHFWPLSPSRPVSLCFDTNPGSMGWGDWFRRFRSWGWCKGDAQPEIRWPCEWNSEWESKRKMSPKEFFVSVCVLVINIIKHTFKEKAPLCDHGRRMSPWPQFLVHLARISTGLWVRSSMLHKEKFVQSDCMAFQAKRAWRVTNKSLLAHRFSIVKTLAHLQSFSLGSRHLRRRTHHRHHRYPGQHWSAAAAPVPWWLSLINLM